MHRLLIVVCFLLPLQMLSANSTQKVQSKNSDKPALSIKIAGPQSAVKSTEPVILKVTVTNVSDKDISFLKPPRERDALFQDKVEVQDDTGKAVGANEVSKPPTDANTIASTVMGSQVLHTLKPGQTFEYQLELSKSHNLSKPGKYVVRMHHLDESSKSEVMSNAVTISVGDSGTN